MQYLITSLWDRRAFAVYFRNAATGGFSADQPREQPDTYVDQVTGRHYVVLHNGDGILAVFRAMDDRIRRLKRWPASLTALYS